MAPLSPYFTITWMLAYALFAWPYIRSIWQKDVVFHPYSWLLWVLLGSINAYALWFQGNVWSFIAQMWSILFWIFFCVYWFYTSQKLQLNWIDTVCLIGGLAALAILIFAGLTEATYAIIFVDFIAIIPTWKKIYQNPKTDKILPWFGSFVTLGLYLIAIRNWTFESTTFWIYLIIVNTSTWLYLLYRRNKSS